MTDRFSLEQQILECWKVTDDLDLLVKQGAPVESFKAVSVVYNHRFEQLWATFEQLVAKGEIL